MDADKLIINSDVPTPGDRPQGGADDSIMEVIGGVTVVDFVILCVPT